LGCRATTPATASASCTRTVDRLIRNKKLRAYKVGSRVMVFADSIDEYLKREVFDAGAAS
jgi:excisionase family DNA binding protein